MTRTDRFKFYIYHDGQVPVHLSETYPVVSFLYGGPDEEGYSQTWETYTLCEGDDGFFVMREEEIRSRDCDGAHESTFCAICPVGKLGARWVLNDDTGLMFPAPARQSHPERPNTCRDHSAEQAGY